MALSDDVLTKGMGEGGLPAAFPGFCQTSRTFEELAVAVHAGDQRNWHPKQAASQTSEAIK